MALSYRPDIRREYTIDEVEIAIVFIEVLLNNNLDLAVDECTLCLIDQLQFYRNFDTTCTEVKGFVLPTSNPNKMCSVLEVLLQWDSSMMRFQSSLKHCENFLDNLDQVIQKQVAVARNVEKDD